MDDLEFKEWCNKISNLSVEDIYESFKQKDVGITYYFGSILMYTYLNLCGAGKLDAKRTDEIITGKIEKGESLDDIKGLLKKDEYLLYNEKDLEFIYKAHTKYFNFYKNKVFNDVIEGNIKKSKISEDFTNNLEKILSSEDKVTKRMVNQFFLNKNDRLKELKDYLGDEFKKFVLTNIKNFEYSDKTNDDFLDLLEYTIKEVYGDIDSICETYSRHTGRTIRYHDFVKTDITPEKAIQLIVPERTLTRLNMKMEVADKKGDKNELADLGKKLMILKKKSVTKIKLFNFIKFVQNFEVNKELSSYNIANKIIKETKKRINKELSNIDFNNNVEQITNDLLKLNIGYQEEDLITTKYTIKTNNITISGEKKPVIKTLNKIHRKSNSSIDEFDKTLVRIINKEKTTTKIFQELISMNNNVNTESVNTIINEINYKLPQNIAQNLKELSKLGKEELENRLGLLEGLGREEDPIIQTKIATIKHLLKN